MRVSRPHRLAEVPLLVLMAARGATALGQILDVSGGASSMYDSQGGSLTLHGDHYESGVSAGTVGGHVLAGGHLAYGRGATRYMLGMEDVPLDLPTDILSGGHRLIGLGADVKTTRWGVAAELFAGTTSTRFESPLVEAARPNDAVAVLLLHRALTPKLSLSTQLLFSPKTRTILQSIAWKAKPSVRFALTGGTGAGKPYAAGSVIVNKPRLDLSAEYIETGSGFQRTGSQIDPTAESVRENVLFTLRSSSSPRVTLSGGRQNMLALPLSADGSGVLTPPAGTTPTIATVDEVSSYFRLGKTGLNGSFLHSTFRGQADLGLVASFSVPLTRQITAELSYFESRLIGGATPQAPVRFGLGHFQEILNNRWTAMQTITVAGSQTTVGSGGSFISNFITVSSDYETFYLPTRPANPFQQSLVLDLRINLFGRLQVHAGSFVSPQGKLLYTADAHGVVARRGTFVPTVEQANLSRFVIAGNVVDTAGDGVEGAAIRIEGQVLYTNSGGRFVYREKKEATHDLVVLADQFLDGQPYTVVSQPMTVKSSEAALRVPLTIVVAHTAGNAIHDEKVTPHEEPKP